MNNARQMASRILLRIEKEQAFAAAVMEAEMGALTDERDMALCNELVLGVLRRRNWLDHLLHKASGREALNVDVSTATILRVAAYQLAFLDRIPDRAAVSEAVNQIKQTSSGGLAGLANAILRNIGRMPASDRIPVPPTETTPPEQLALACGLQPWLMNRLIAERGVNEAIAICGAFSAPSRRTLRVNLNRAEPSDLCTRYEGLSTEKTWLRWSVAVDNRKSARELEEEGLAAFQDEGSGLVVAALGALENCSVLDACAGRGGKTGTIAMQMRPEDRLVAADRKKSKLDRLLFDFKRQQLFAETRVGDLLKPAPEQSEQFDRVLLDAPCSGTGTIGRRPEIRWKLTEADVTSLIAVQRAMLDRIADSVTPGGRLVFATCSILASEHTDHLDEFLAKHPAFSPAAAPPPLWPEGIPWNNGAPFINPALTGTDGYGILCLDRSK